MRLLDFLSDANISLSVNFPFVHLSFPLSQLSKIFNYDKKKTKYKINKFSDRTFKVTPSEPKNTNLAVDLKQFHKITSRFSVNEAENANWRVGYRFIKDPKQNDEFVFHVFQDIGSNAFHSRIFARINNNEQDNDVWTKNIAIENPKNFVLTVQKKANQLMFYGDDIFLGRFDVPLDEISGIALSAWAHENKTPVTITIENIRVYMEIPEKDAYKAERKRNQIIETNKDWHEQWWVKYLVLPLLVVLIGGYVIYKFGWTGTDREFHKNEVNVITNSLASVVAEQKINNLRALEPLETGKTIGQLPNDVYFFSSPLAIQYEVENPKDDFIKVTSVDKSYYFELAKINSRYYLLGFITDEAYSNVGTINERPITATLFPNRWGVNTHAIAIPFDAIIRIKEREIDVDQTKSISILDLEFKEIIDKPKVHKTEML